MSEDYQDTIKKFKNHPSTEKIKENHQGHFSFSIVKLKDINRETIRLMCLRPFSKP